MIIKAQRSTLALENKNKSPKTQFLYKMGISKLILFPMLRRINWDFPIIYGMHDWYFLSRHSPNFSVYQYCKCKGHLCITTTASLYFSSFAFTYRRFHKSQFQWIIYDLIYYYITLWTNKRFHKSHNILNIMTRAHECLIAYDLI